LHIVIFVLNLLNTKQKRNG